MPRLDLRLRRRRQFWRWRPANRHALYRAGDQSRVAPLHRKDDAGDSATATGINADVADLARHAAGHLSGYSGDDKASADTADTTDTHKAVLHRLLTRKRHVRISRQRV